MRRDVITARAALLADDIPLPATLVILGTGSGRSLHARSHLTKGKASERQDVSLQLGSAEVHAILGERDQALDIVETWDREGLHSEDQFYMGALAAVYAILGDREMAIERLLDA